MVGVADSVAGTCRPGRETLRAGGGRYPEDRLESGNRTQVAVLSNRRPNVAAPRPEDRPPLVSRRGRETAHANCWPRGDGERLTRRKSQSRQNRRIFTQGFPTLLADDCMDVHFAARDCGFESRRAVWSGANDSPRVRQVSLCGPPAVVAPTLPETKAMPDMAARKDGSRMPSKETVDSVVAELKGLARESCRKTWMRNGAKEPLFGVLVGDMQPIRKRIQGNHELALGLYATGISDAMYLAGLVADPHSMTAADLDRWVSEADWALLVCAVAGVAAESEYGTEAALRWIDDQRPHIAECGWTTLTNIVSITPDEEIDVPKCRALLKRVTDKIHAQPNRVRYAMNGFVIGLGCFVPALTEAALAAADRIGPVEVDMGETGCKVPAARAYIEKVRDRGTLGKKKKSARC